ncbi:uncharacterized protein [Miscanthus floridulus]|uniref:uncharacterized protein n=1 Tax=Miscanthus floridulus TaxID=154761 RepID=UPI0034584212
MGAFLSSVSGHGHPSHPEHCARFNRVGRNDSPPSPCRMCKLNVETRAAAYRCSEPGCAVVLHDACYRRPTTLKRHFAHPRHHLTLGADTRACLSCSLCAKPLGTPTVAYSCARSSMCAGFSAHPRCCDLPKSISTPPELHEHNTRFVLRPPSSAAGGNGGGEVARPRRTCLKCGKTAATTAGRKKAAPWSYQCTKCAGKEYCLACVLGNGGSTVRCCCLPCCDVDPAAVHCVGQLAGVFFCGFLSGMGCPATQLYPADMELAPRYRT